MAWDSLIGFQGAQSQKEGQCSLEIHQAIPKLSSYPYLEACPVQLLEVDAQGADIEVLELGGGSFVAAR